MNQIIAKFDELLSLFPAGSLQLKQGASETGLSDLEAMLQTPLPDFLRHLLSNSNGQKDAGATLLGQFRFLPAEIVSDDYRLHLKYSQEIKNTDAATLHDNRVLREKTWHPGWISIGRIFNNSLFIDQAPTTNGRFGQIVIWNGDDCFGRVVARDFEHLLSRTLLLAKQTTFEAELGFSFQYDSLPI